MENQVSYYAILLDNPNDTAGRGKIVFSSQDKYETEEFCIKYLQEHREQKNIIMRKSHTPADAEEAIVSNNTNEYENPNTEFTQSINETKNKKGILGYLYFVTIAFYAVLFSIWISNKYFLAASIITATLFIISKIVIKNNKKLYGVWLVVFYLAYMAFALKYFVWFYPSENPNLPTQFILLILFPVIWYLISSYLVFLFMQTLRLINKEEQEMIFNTYCLFPNLISQNRIPLIIGNFLGGVIIITGLAYWYVNSF